MVDTYVENLQTTLSTERLNAYRPAGGDDIAMIATYFWNVTLCQSLYPPLGALEVAMRNSIHNTLRTHLGRDDWYDIPRLLHEKEQSAIDKVKQSIRDAKRDEIVAGRDPVIPGRVIAGLTFGNWTSLLDKGYGAGPRGPQFWTETTGLLSLVFPHAPGTLNSERVNLHRYINRLRLLRNRVFHYEPVWNGVLLPARNRKDPLEIVSVAELHNQILEAISWISPSVAGTVQHLDTFSDAYSHGRRRVEAEIHAYLKIS